MSNPSFAMKYLSQHLEGAAEWRDQKAAEFPEDTRNAEAATLLRRLSESCWDTIQGREGPWISAYEQHCLIGDADMDHRVSEALSEYGRLIGFHEFPDDAEEICRDLLKRCGIELPEVAA